MIRTATEQDAEALAELARATFPLACPPSTSPENIEAFIVGHLAREHFEKYLADPSRLLIVAQQDERLIGYTMTIFAEPADADVAGALTVRPTAELSKVYVRAEHHGSGISTELVAGTIEAARARDIAALWLGVNQHNARANRFYERQGFRQVGVKRFTVGDSVEDDYVREFVYARA